MTHRPLVTRCIGIGAVVIAASRCGGTPAPIDLLAALPTAERRAAGPIDRAIVLIAVAGDRGTEPVLQIQAPARVSYPVRLGAHAWLRGDVMLATGSGEGVTVRVGIADTRTYEELLHLPVNPPRYGIDTWRTVDLDLGAYSGWQWSLFYRPSGITWKLIFNADPTPSGSVIWRRLRIEMAR